MHGQALFEKVVELCGVSAVLAPGLVRRSLSDGKVGVDAATVADYRVALPRLLARLRAYMPEEEAQRRARRIGGMLTSLDAGRQVEGEDEADWSLIGRVTDALRSGTPAEGSLRQSGSWQADSGQAGSGQAGASASKGPPSGELAIELDDEPTLMGRRYTAHERRIMGTSGVVSRDSVPRGDSAEIDLRTTDLRKTKR